MHAGTNAENAEADRQTHYRWNNNNYYDQNTCHFSGLLKVLELLFHFKGSVDELPTDYDNNRCNWTCANWAGKGDGDAKNYCEDNWSQHQHCAPNTNGLIKDYCKFSCNNWGKIKKSIISEGTSNYEIFVIIHYSNNTFRIILGSTVWPNLLNVQNETEDDAYLWIY